MLLWCPECGVRHVDKGEFAVKVRHTHACQHCGTTWRPAVVPTAGVAFLPGFKDGVASNPAPSKFLHSRPDVTVDDIKADVVKFDRAELSALAVAGHVPTLLRELEVAAKRAEQAEAALADERRRLLADEERRKLTGDALQAEQERDAARAEVRALRDLATSVESWVERDIPDADLFMTVSEWDVGDLARFASRMVEKARRALATAPASAAPPQTSETSVDLDGSRTVPQGCESNRKIGPSRIAADTNTPSAVAPKSAGPLGVEPEPPPCPVDLAALERLSTLERRLDLLGGYVEKLDDVSATSSCSTVVQLDDFVRARDAWRGELARRSGQ